ncbi:MAG: cyclase family protein [Gemmatimonadaceae bacterium]
MSVLLIVLVTRASGGMAQAGARPRAAPLAHPGTASNVVDLTHTLTPEFPYILIPGVTFPFKLTPIATLEEHGVAANRWEIHEHLGTQIDAPSHFIAGGLTLDQVPARSFIAPLAVIDISDRAMANADAVVTVADIRAWEAAHGPLPAGAAVFMYSGWESRVGDPTAFLNTDSSGTWHFPGFSEQAAAFLLTERDVVGIGVDVISIDPGRDKSYATHRTWLAANKWAVECVANLAQVPPSGATAFIGATKVGGATGGPVRIIATWRSENPGAGAPAPPVIHQHVGGAPDAFANAYLIETDSGVIAVDATMTAAEGARLRARLDARRKPLLAVLLTHPHPDHYGGITSLVGPDRVPIFATAAVNRIVRRDDAAKNTALTRARIAWPTRRTFPTRTLASGESVTLGGVRFTVHDAGAAESHADSYWIMDGPAKAVFLGDLAVNGVHAYMADGHGREWLAALDRLTGALRGITALYPGHGAAGDIAMLDRTRAYVDAYRKNVAELAGGGSTLTPVQKQELERRMAAYVVGDRLAGFVSRGADAVAAELARERRR